MTRLMAFDPGETTGYALFEDGQLTLHGTVKGLKATWKLLENIKPEVLSVETFRLYPGRAAAKIYSSFPEIEVIGILRLWGQLNKVPWHEQMASVAKQRFPDDRLKKANVYTPNRHSRDAIRHGLVVLHNENNLR